MVYRIMGKIYKRGWFVVFIVDGGCFLSWFKLESSSREKSSIYEKFLLNEVGKSCCVVVWWSWLNSSWFRYDL